MDRIPLSGLLPIEEKIVIASESNDLFELTEQFGSGGKREPSDTPLKRIFQLVLAQGCKTILVENDYKDKEWSSEYDHFYGKLFKSYSRGTKRLHFFKEAELTNSDISNLAGFQDSYLGFCVLRPLEGQKVVNAIIKPMEDKNTPCKSFILCQETFPVEINVNNNIQKLSIMGFPFIQQDGQAGCCAHAALMMADRFLVQQKNTETGETAEPHFVKTIADYVSSVPSTNRRNPTGGLGPFEISEALRKMGYSPLVYHYSKNERGLFPSERIIYHYLESKIPIYLSIPTEGGRHALTVIGHSFEPDTWWALAEIEYLKRRPSGGNYHCSTSWIPNFIVHDDNFGPYLTVPKEYLWKSEQEGGLTVVIPLPHKIIDEQDHSEKIVNMNGEWAEMLACSLLESTLSLYGCPIPENEAGVNSNQPINSETKKWLDRLFEHYKRKDLVLRTCLISRNKLLNDYIPSHLIQKYKEIKLPAKVWLTEISIPEIFGQFRLRLGEILMDPSAPATLPAPFLTIHIPGHLITRDVDSEQTNLHDIFNDLPYQHMIRC
jgi:hypothetical protein